MSTAARMSKPQANEHNPYYTRYIELIPSGDVVAILEEQVAETLAVLRSISESKANQRYAADKWSIKELLGHMNDAERIMSYRALRIARADQTPIAGFEQDDYVRAASHANCKWESLIAEFEAVRKATVLLFKNLQEDAWTLTGTANGDVVSVRALAYIIAGHELHHLRVLKEKYLGG